MTVALERPMTITRRIDPDVMVAPEVDPVQRHQSIFDARALLSLAERRGRRLSQAEASELIGLFYEWAVASDESPFGAHPILVQRQIAAVVGAPVREVGDALLEVDAGMAPVRLIDLLPAA